MSISLTIGEIMKKVFAVFFVVFMVLVLPITALAAEFRVSDNNAGSADLAKDETAKNLYAAGNTVNVSGTTEGDLVVAGNTLNLSGPVEDGLFAAGANINLSGKVGHNARVGGSNVSLSNTTEGDLFVGGGMLNLTNQAKVGGDFFAGVGTLTMSGEIAGRASIAGGDITINGPINGDLKVDANKLTLGDKAVINGRLIYRAPVEATISKSAVVKGATDYTKTAVKNENYHYSKSVLGIFGFFGLIMGLALLFVIVYVLPKTSYNLVAQTLDNFWANLGWGFLTFAVAPTALIIVAITMVGLKLAGVLALFYIAYFLIACTFATLVIGSQVLKWFEKKELRVDWATILIGMLGVIILGLIPVLGSLIIFAVGLSVLGQLVGNTGSFLKSQRK